MNNAAMRMILFVGVLGLWPFWVAVVWVIAGSMSAAASKDYWSAAPWIIVASVPASVVTTLVAFAARYVFHRAEGETLRKSVLAGLSYVGILLLLIGMSKCN